MTAVRVRELSHLCDAAGHRVAAHDPARKVRPRVRGKSNYGTLDRLAVSILDLIGVAWLQRRGKRPVIEPEA